MLAFKSGSPEMITQLHALKKVKVTNNMLAKADGRQRYSSNPSVTQC
jgi:hypothetical protein